MSSQQGVQSDGSFVGTVFRAHNPQWAWEPLSGEGARRNGGRFNRRGTPALYTSLTILGAIREANPFDFQLQPITLCAYDVNIRPIFDATNTVNLESRGLTSNDLACRNWRTEMLSGITPITQTLADELLQEGFAGILVRSFARGTTETDLNLVLSHYDSDLPTKVTLVDDDGRLSSSSSYEVRSASDPT